MDLKKRITQRISEGRSNTQKKGTLKDRKFINKNKKLMDIIQKRKKRSQDTPVNYYKTQRFYIEKTIQDRRKYNKAMKHTMNLNKRLHGHKNTEKSIFYKFRESLPKGTSLNVLPAPTVNTSRKSFSPLYEPPVSYEESHALIKNLSEWQRKNRRIRSKK